jgi:RecB family exonuclease
MALRIYHLPPGTGGTRNALLGETLGGLEGPDYSRVLYLAPTRHLVERFRREFHSLAGGCYIPPRSMTLRESARNVHYTYGEGIVFPPSLMPVLIVGLTGCGMGTATLAVEFMGELKEHYPGESVQDMKKRVLEAFSSLETHEEASRRAVEALDMIALVEETLGNHGALTREDLFPLAAAMVKEHLEPPDVLFLDGFYEVSPAEELFLTSLIKGARETLVTIPISGSDDDLSYCYSAYLKKYFNVEPAFVPPERPLEPLTYRAVPSMEEEVQDVAREIKADYIAGRRRDLEGTFLVFPRLAPYRSMVERVFQRYGIPVSLPAGGKSLLERPYQDVLGLLEAYLGDYPRSPTAGFLTSPFFRKIPGEIAGKAPRVMLSSGIIKGRGAWVRAFRDAGVDSLERAVFRKLAPLGSPAIKRSYKMHAKALRDVLSALAFVPGGEGDGAGFERALRRLGHLDGVLPEGTDLRGFADALARVLDELPEPLEEKGVRVAELKDVRGLEPGVLYMAGLRDGDLPSRPKMDILLPDSVRRKLGLVDLKRHMHLEGHIFTRLAFSARRAVLSYPSMEGDTVFLPSVLLSGAEEVERAVSPLILSAEEKLLTEGREPFSVHIREASNLRRYSEEQALSVTHIDSYRACPRRFLLEKVLGLSPPEVLDYEIEPLTMGSIIHSVMEMLVDAQSPDLEAMKRDAEVVLEKVLGETALDGYFKELVRETFMGLVPALYEIEDAMRQEGYRFREAEYDVRGEPLPGIVLKGKVDRIDAGAGGEVRIIDYKTGSPNVNSSGVLCRGANLQLFLYAAVLKTLGMRPERVGIYSLRDLGVKWFPTKRDMKKGLTLEDFMTSALRYLEGTVGGMRQGSFPARPIEEQFCRLCHERPYCPFVQGGVEAERRNNAYEFISFDGKGDDGPRGMRDAARR